MLDIRRLRLLRELSHHGTIAAVAEALNYTASAVSQQLATLEREAGVPLLERSSRRVTLTPAAEALVCRAESVFEQLELAEAELAHTRTGLAGTLRIGSYPSATRALLPAALTRLKERHPGLAVRSAELDPAEVPDALRAGSLDLALLQHHDGLPIPAHPGITSVAVFSEELYLAVPRSSTEHNPGPGLWSVRDYPWIVGTPGTFCHGMTIRICEAAGFTPEAVHHCDDFGTVLAFVAAGLGVAIVPQLGLANVPESVTHIPLPGTGRHTSLATRRGGQGHPAVVAFTRAMRGAVTVPGVTGDGQGLSWPAAPVPGTLVS